jgi:hypothetical protein
MIGSEFSNRRPVAASFFRPDREPLTGAAAIARAILNTRCIEQSVSPRPEALQSGFEVRAWFLVGRKRSLDRVRYAKEAQ